MLRRLLPILAAVGVVALWAVLAYVPPDRLGTPDCQIRSLTGFHCPGCGGTRAARHLSRGEVSDAVQANLLVLPIVAITLWGLLAIAGYQWAGKRWWTSEKVSLRVALAAGVLVIVFTVLRNLDVGAFLRP